jgi:hypothetical protein
MGMLHLGLKSHFLNLISKYNTNLHLYGVPLCASVFLSQIFQKS